MGASSESFENKVVSTFATTESDRESAGDLKVSDEDSKVSAGFNVSAITCTGKTESLTLAGIVSVITVNNFGNLVLHGLLASKGYVIKTIAAKKIAVVFIFAYTLDWFCIQAGQKYSLIP